MKRILYLILFLVFHFLSDAQTAKNSGIDFYRNIVALHQQTNQSFLDYQIILVQSEKQEEHEAAKNKFITLDKNIINQIKKMPTSGNPNCESYKNSVVFYMEQCLLNLTEKSAELEKLRTSNEDADYVRYLTSLDKLEDLQDEKFEKLSNYADTLAKKENFIIDKKDDEYDKKTKLISKINRYDRAYIITFNRVLKLNNAFFEIIEDKNFEKGAAIRKKIIALSQYALDRIKLIGAFGKDDTYQKAGLEMFTHFKSCAEQQYGKALGFIKTPEKDITPEKVKLFNEFVESYNQNAKFSNDFSKQRDDFLKKYYPKL
jgi:hypothetical protein